MRTHARLATLLGVILPFAAGRTVVQEGQKPAGGPVAAADVGGVYEDMYRALTDTEPDSVLVVAIDRLSIERPGASFLLEQGALHVLPAIEGRWLIAVFVGRGSFRYAPPLAVERGQLFRAFGDSTVSDPLSWMVLVAADGMLDSVVEHGSPQVQRAGAAVRDALSEAIEYLSEDEGMIFDSDIMRAALNPAESGLFYAHVEGRGDPLMYLVSPYLEEDAVLMRKSKARGAGKVSEVVSAFASGGRSAMAGETITEYVLDVGVMTNVWGKEPFNVRARTTLVGAEASRWVPLILHSSLEVDSARWTDGSVAEVSKVRESPYLWIRTPSGAASGDGARLELYYQGDLVERFGDWFFIQSSIAWYPRTLDGRAKAAFDITFHNPSSYVLASVGTLVDSTVVDRVLTTRWISPEPMRNASFNMGIFEPYERQEDGGPPVTVLYSEEGHRTLKFAGVSQHRNMKEQVGDDVAKSLKFFSHLFGPPPTERFYATEIPYAHGEAFPGLVHLALVTFAWADKEGGDAVFRAHEVAHQWWGIGVDFASYRDQWLSEGFSEFAGLWYLQIAMRDNEKYFRFLREWRDGLVRSRDAHRGRGLGPLALGYRSVLSDDELGTGLIVYQKGAWVLHMLRLLMIDLNTMDEDTFTGTLRDFYRDHRGRRATTRDFQAVAERRLGMSLDWFFRQWVEGTAIPTYHVAHRSEAVGDGRYRLTLRVRQENVPPDFQMYVPVSVDLGGNRFARARVHVTGPLSEIDLPLMPAEPRGIRFNELEAVLCEVEHEKW